MTATLPTTYAVAEATTLVDELAHLDSFAVRAAEASRIAAELAAEAEALHNRLNTFITGKAARDAEFDRRLDEHEVRGERLMHQLAVQYPEHFPSNVPFSDAA